MQRRAIVTVFNAHRHDMDVTTLASNLASKDILTLEQYQKLASLDDDEKRHEALLYTLLAHNKVVECMRLTGTSLAADLQGMFVLMSSLNNVANCIVSTTYVLYTCSMQPHSRICWNLRVH